MSSSATLLVSSVRISWVVTHLFHLNTLFRVFRVSKIIHVLCLFIYAVVSDIVCILNVCVQLCGDLGLGKGGLILFVEQY